MAPKSQNKPPGAPTPSNEKYTVDEVFVDKKGKMPSSRQAFAVLNLSADLPPTSGPPSSSGSDCGVIEFSKEDVEALLVEKRKKKNQFNTKEQLDQMSDYIRRLKQCIKWFQQLEGTYVSELASLKSLLESEEKKCEAKDMLMKSKEEELNEIIMELRKNLAVLRDNLKREESEKMEALNSFSREKEARVAAESLQASLSEELKRTQRDLTVANQKDIQIQYLNDSHRRLQEYNTSLQQYNSNLQSELADKNEKLKLVEKEKAVVVEHLSASRLHCTSLQKELESYRAAQDEAIKAKRNIGC